MYKFCTVRNQEGNSMIKKLVIIGTVILSLTGCFRFQSPPFADKDLELISETEFGKEVLRMISKVSFDKESPIAKLKKSINGDDKVLVINDELLVTQEKKKGFWELTMIMKNSSHIMFCNLFSTDKEIPTPPQSIQLSKEKNMMGNEYTVSGSGEEVKQFALKLIETNTKMCLSVPLNVMTEY